MGRSITLLILTICLNSSEQAITFNVHHKASAKPSKTTVTATKPWTPAERHSATDALKLLRKLHVATLIGISQVDYRSRLIDASSDITEDLRTMPSGSVNKSISDALKAYIDAATLWQTASSDNTTKDFNSDSDVSAIQSRYQLPQVSIDPSVNQQLTQLLLHNIDVALQRSKNPNGSSDDDEIQNDQDDKAYKQQVQQAERTALDDYAKSSLSSIWAIGDRLEQKAEATLAKSN